VRERFPTVGRVILSGQVDRETILDALASGIARTFLITPWDDVALGFEIVRVVNGGSS